MKEQYEDRIDAYLLGKMTDQERLQFEEDVKSDPELKEELEFARDVKAALESRAEKLMAIKQWSRKYEQEMAGAVPARKTPRQGLYWAGGIAAVLVLGFFLFSNTPKVEEDNMAPTTVAQVGGSIRGIDAAIENMLDQADYQAALDSIEALEESIHSEARSLQGKIDSGEASKENLDKKTMLQNRQLDLSWLKAKALLGLGRKEEAAALLDEIRRHESEYQEKADSLYNLLRK